MNVGLIAHDSKKKLMQNFCIAYKGILCKHNLYATGTTGKLIEEVTNLNVHKYLPGHLGSHLLLSAQMSGPHVLVLPLCAALMAWNLIPSTDSQQNSFSSLPHRTVRTTSIWTY